MSDHATTTVSELAPITFGDQLADIVAPLRHSLEQAEARLDAIQTAEKAQKAEITKMRRALSVVDPDYQPLGKPRARAAAKKGLSHVGVTRSNGTATGFGISVERAGDFAKQILNMTDAGAQFVTQRGVYLALNTDQGTASSAFKFLRDIEMIGKAGRDPDTRAERWKVLDKDAYDKYVATLEPQDAGSSV